MFASLGLLFFASRGPLAFALLFATRSPFAFAMTVVVGRKRRWEFAFRIVIFVPVCFARLECVVEVALAVSVAVVAPLEAALLASPILAV